MRAPTATGPLAASPARVWSRDEPVANRITGHGYCCTCPLSAAAEGSPRWHASLEEDMIRTSIRVVCALAALLALALLLGACGDAQPAADGTDGTQTGTGTATGPASGD